MGDYNTPKDIIDRFKDLARRVSRIESPRAEPWHTVGTLGEPAFKNGWINEVESVQFRKDATGVVFIRGRISNNTADHGEGDTIFTLPSGYRPSDGLRSIIAFANPTGFATVLIESSTGDVSLNYRSGVFGWVSLSSISFSTV